MTSMVKAAFTHMTRTKGINHTHRHFVGNFFNINLLYNRTGNNYLQIDCLGDYNIFVLLVFRLISRSNL